MTTTANQRPRAPQDYQRPRPRKPSPADRKEQDELMERGIAFTDTDGARIVVRVKDVRGKHEAALVAAVGCDFMGLLQRLTERQGTDLLAAVYWFGRLVNGRDAGEYVDVLEDFGYENFLDMDLGDPEEDEDAPKASAND